MATGKKSMKQLISEAGFGNVGLTVKDLINILKFMNPEAIVIVERASEYRILQDTEVVGDDNRTGGEIETDEGEIVNGPVVRITTWG